MKILSVPANFYQQFDADFSLDVPGEGYGGWKKATLDLNLDRTALVVMHAWDCGSREEYPGWHRAVEYIPRADEVCRSVFPKLLAAVRNAGMKLYHVASSEDYCKQYSGYQRTKALAPMPRVMETVEEDEIYGKLLKFRHDNVFPGADNVPDIQRGFARLGFPKEANPAEDEGIAVNADQLFALCKRDGVNHLIYTGFAINWCLLMVDGGMVDMSRRGLICSTIRQAVTAVENKETARNELCKELALWRTAVAFGFIYELDDFLEAISRDAYSSNQ